MFQSIVNAIVALWEKLCAFVVSILQWILDVISAAFGVVVGIFQFLFYAIFDQISGLFLFFFATLDGYFPTMDIYSDSFLGYMSTWNQVFPITEGFACAFIVFSYWLACLGIKMLLKLIPTIY